MDLEIGVLSWNIQQALHLTTSIFIRVRQRETHTHVQAHAHMGSRSGHKAEKDLKMFTLKSAVIWHYWGMLAGRPRNTSWKREGMDLVLEPSEGAQL